MLIAPKWVWTRRIVISGLIPLLLGSVYLVLIVLYFGNTEGSFGSLAGVMKLFEDPNAVLAGWIHYLAFDLFVGSWELRNSQKHGINHFLVVPCLLLTFMLGPIGLLTYFGLRALHSKRIIHENF